MQLAANKVIKDQGGYAVVNDKKLLAFTALPIAGILSADTMPNLAAQISSVEKSLRLLGYKHNNIIMSLSTLALPVSPAFKVTDKGIVDVKRQTIVSLIKENYN